MTLSHVCTLTMADMPLRNGKLSFSLDQMTESTPAATMDMPTTEPTTEWVVETGSCGGRAGKRGVRPARAQPTGLSRCEEEEAAAQSWAAVTPGGRAGPGCQPQA